MPMLAFQRKRIRICPQDFVTYQVREPGKKAKTEQLGRYPWRTDRRQLISVCSLGELSCTLIPLPAQQNDFLNDTKSILFLICFPYHPFSSVCLFPRWLLFPLCKNQASSGVLQGTFRHQKKSESYISEDLEGLKKEPFLPSKGVEMTWNNC